MAPMEHVLTMEQEGPSTHGTTGVPLSQNWVVFLTPKPGDRHKEAIGKYEAYLYYKNNSTGNRADLRTTTKGTWEPTVPDGGPGRGPRGKWRFEFKPLIFVFPGFYHYEAEFRMAERIRAGDPRGELMFVQPSDRSISIQYPPPPPQLNGHGPSANGERH
ncbi:hypothetical protein GE09DRAFT_1271080 [Coniochaeta sp. 2T2.1]|nr:hypothetical protein GE09DRAFT_1271080 [Coniochaeta sp. 2T2.1]